jgi:hypothetical protein
MDAWSLLFTTATYYYLSEGAHRGQENGKTAIIHGDDLGFKCFSSDCEDYHMSDLLELLEDACFVC